MPSETSDIKQEDQTVTRVPATFHNGGWKGQPEDRADFAHAFKTLFSAGLRIAQAFLDACRLQSDHAIARVGRLLLWLNIGPGYELRMLEAAKEAVVKAHELEYKKRDYKCSCGGTLPTIPEESNEQIQEAVLWELLESAVTSAFESTDTSPFESTVASAFDSTAASAFESTLATLLVAAIASASAVAAAHGSTLESGH